MLYFHPYHSNLTLKRKLYSSFPPLLHSFPPENVSSLNNLSYSLLTPFPCVSSLNSIVEIFFFFEMASTTYVLVYPVYMNNFK